MLFSSICLIAQQLPGCLWRNQTASRSGLCAAVDVVVPALHGQQAASLQCCSHFPDVTINFSPQYFSIVHLSVQKHVSSRTGRSGKVCCNLAVTSPWGDLMPGLGLPAQWKALQSDGRRSGGYVRGAHRWWVRRQRSVTTCRYCTASHWAAQALGRAAATPTSVGPPPPPLSPFRAPGPQDLVPYRPVVSPPREISSASARSASARW